MKVNIRDRDVLVYWNYDKVILEPLMDKHNGKIIHPKETTYNGKVKCIAVFGEQDNYSATVNVCRSEFPTKKTSIRVGKIRIILEEGIKHDCFTKSKGRKVALKALLDMLTTNHIKLNRVERRAFWDAYKASIGGAWLKGKKPKTTPIIDVAIA